MNQRYDCAAQEIFPNTVIVSFMVPFMCAHWEALGTTLTHFLSGDKKLRLVLVGPAMVL